MKFSGLSILKGFPLSTPSPTGAEEPDQIISPPTVIVCDSQPGRLERVSGLIAGCGIRTVTVEGIGILRKRRPLPPPPPTIIVVGIGGALDRTDLDVIRSVKDGGAKVICYQDDFPLYPLPAPFANPPTFASAPGSKLLAISPVKSPAISPVIGASLGPHRFQRAVSAGRPIVSSMRLRTRLRAGSDADPGRASRFMNRLRIIKERWRLRSAGRWGAWHGWRMLEGAITENLRITTHTGGSKCLT
jgi:hypothetical protein